VVPSEEDLAKGVDCTLLEVNTLPGFTDTSLYPEAAGIAGIAMDELCSGFAMAAFERGPTKRNVPLELPK
jgi:D-alanine-D-alanine ligase-like ATP-grasp enzyme